MESEIMTLDDFLLNTPLYAKVSEEDGASDIIYSLYGINRYKTCINGYNPIDKCDTTFFLYYGLGSIKSSNKNINDITYHPNIISHYDTHEVIFICSRYNTLFHFLIHIEVYDSKKILPLCKSFYTLLRNFYPHSYNQEDLKVEIYCNLFLLKVNIQTQ